jgi:adenylate cyclase
MASGDKEIKKALRGGFLGMIAFGLALLFYTQGWLAVPENKSWDFRVKAGAQAQASSKDIVLILLDQNSLDWVEKTMGLTWLWPREIYGAVVSFCRRTGVRSLGFDVIYSSPSSYGVADDAGFGRALERAGNVANAIVLGTTSGQAKAWPSHLERQRFRLTGLDGLSGEQPVSEGFSGITFPVPEVAKASAVLCNVNLPPDGDGIYRKVPVFNRFQNQAVPSLGLGVYLAAHPDAKADLKQGRLTIDGRVIPLDEDGRAILNYRGPSGTHEVYSAAWVIQSELRAREGQALDDQVFSAFKDKYVFFGFSAPGLLDIHSTPVDSQSPGVEIHATLLDNLLSGDFMAEVPFRLTLVFTAVLVVFCGVLTALYTRALPMFSIVFLFLMLPVGAGFLAYAKGFWLPIALPLVSVVLTIVLSLVVNYATEGRRRRFIKNAFHHYLSPQVIDQILQDPDRLSLGGERRALSIFFSDLESFTSLSETMEPEELVRFLNQYLTAMTDIIHRHGGTIDKYEGDAIIAFWNAPLDTPDHARLAVQAALDCQAKLEAMRPEFKAWTGRWVRMRIGLNTGPAVVGNLGSDTRFDYTMIGDAVNLAARLESANKGFGTYTMISQETLDAAGNEVAYRPLGQIRVIGKEQPVRIHEPLDQKLMDGETGTSLKRMIETFEQGLELYEQGDFQRALDLFSAIEEQDPAARAYARNCEVLRKDPPEDWDGVWRLTSK